MFKGFYNLTSGILTHQRNLNVIADNMTNISTSGYKQDRYTASTFDDVMYSRVGNEDSTGPEIGRQSYIRATSQIYTDFTQGTIEPTGLPLDFAIEGEGFFAVQGVDGDRFYTRMGNFSLDDDGYLCLPGYGRILNPQGQPIWLGTDKILGDAQGNIYVDDGVYGGDLLGQVGVFAFADNAALDRNENGFFVGDGAQLVQSRIHHGCLERSNTDLVKQMTEMITFQRSLQSTASVMKMYDTVMSKAANDVGRLQ